MSQTTVPLVSVLICTYNAERFIEPTLRSVLSQTYEELEVLVLDNNSSDTTVQKVQSFGDSRIQLFESDSNLGPYRGLNYLIDRAGGKYVAIQDHDDIWHTQKIQLQVDVLEHNDQYVGCGGQTIKLYENQNTIAVQDSRDGGAEVEVVPHTTLLFRNDGYRYDVSVKYKTDMYFMEEILCDGGQRLYSLGKPLHIALLRADNRNLNMEWTRGVPTNVFSYYRKTGNTKRLLWGLLLSVLPATPADRLKRWLFGYERKPVTHLLEDDFTAPFAEYVGQYTTLDQFPQVVNSDSA